MIDNGPSIIRLVRELLENIMLLTIPKKATDIASSIPDIAMISVGIPFATPYPFVRSLNKHGTTTAGDTAAKTDPETPKN